jgi:hypothetical protein
MAPLNERILKERNDLFDRLFALREAARDLLHLVDLEAAGMAGPGHRGEEQKALSSLRDALGEDGPDDRGAGA